MPMSDSLAFCHFKNCIIGYNRPQGKKRVTKERKLDRGFCVAANSSTCEPYRSCDDAVVKV